MYIVYSGEVKIVQQQAGTNELKEIHRCVAGDYFGERALMTNEPRAGSAIASTQFPQVQLLKLDRSAFHLLLGPLEEIMKDRVETYHQNVERKEEPFFFHNRVNQQDLKELAVLGKGSFGFVKLVLDAKTNQSYALKAVSKQQIVQTGQQGHVMSEKKAMATMDHPFLVKLHATYKDRNRLFFVLDPILGGELFTVLREKTLFDEDTARFYAAHVVLAFEYMHSRGYCYRDLKPENLLIDKDGYLKVTDFGFAKNIGDGRTWTLCGTPDYLAPEIVSGKGHGKGVDWWTLGNGINIFII
jgi:cGMP-dependent protein kinase